MERLDEYLADWIDKRTGLAHATERSYRMRIREHFSALGSIRLRDLSAADVVALHDDLATKNLSRETICRVHATLRKALADAVRAGTIQVNPARDVTVMAGEDSFTSETWTLDESRRFLRYLEKRDKRLHAVFTVLAMTGVRRGEAMALRWAARAEGAEVEEVGP